jgi:hypothetical protein
MGGASPADAEQPPSASPPKAAPDNFSISLRLILSTIEVLLCCCPPTTWRTRHWTLASETLVDMGQRAPYSNRIEMTGRAPSGYATSLL